MKIRASYHQERLWFIHTFESGELYQSGPIYYNIPLVLEIDGPLDIKLVEQSLSIIVNRHESLRTRLIMVEEELFQQIEPKVDFQLQVLDLTIGIGTTTKSPVEMAIDEASRPFSPGKDFLIRVRLTTLSTQKHLLVITLHHLVSDRCSLEIIAAEFASCYQSLLLGTSPSLPDLPLDYADFSQWQRQLPRELLEPLVFYWRRQLAHTSPLELPTSTPRAFIHTFHEASVPFELVGELSTNIRAFCKHHNIQCNVLLMAAFNVLLHRYCGQEDIVIGTSAANRHQPGTKNIVGPLANLLALRSNIPGKIPFKKYFSQFKQTMAQADNHRDIPFDKLVLELNPEKDMSRTVFFDVLFQYEDQPFYIPPIDNLKIKRIETNLGWGKYDLNLFIRREETCFPGILVYNKDYYEDSFASCLIEHYTVLLESILKEPDLPVSHLAILRHDERQQFLFRWNRTQADYPADKTINRLFEEQTRVTPDSVAIVVPSASLGAIQESPLQITYNQLNEESNQLAEVLIEKGIQPDDIIAIMITPSLELIVGLLAILKAGGAYLPIDPDYPKERINYMLADSASEILLTMQDHSKKIKFEKEKIYISEAIKLVHTNHRFSFHPSTLPHFYPSNPLNLAYIIYTSGTTGKPKGCMVTHKNLVRLLKVDGLPFRFSEDDTWIMAHSFCFDFSVWEMYGALLYGGKLIVLSRDRIRDINWFHSLIKQHRVTVLNQTPQAFYSLAEVEQKYPEHSLNHHLRCIIFGGDKLLYHHLSGFLQIYSPGEIQPINMYGITETTVHVTHYSFNKSNLQAFQGRSLIGKPLPETTIYILDSLLNPVPVGVSGEIFVGGTGVARGYLNRPDLTAEKFYRSDRFNRSYRSYMSYITHRSYIYKTGDLGRWLWDGNVEYLGRNDDQVQVRGFRIEPAEIQHHLLSHPAVKEAVVMAWEEKHLQTSLCAYIQFTPDKNPPPLAQVRQYLSVMLPYYMVPSYFVPVKAIPLTPNGKVDKKALPPPAPTSNISKRIPPRTPLEKAIAAIWAQVLELEKDQVGIDDDFFHLGGHSLKATVLIARIHEKLQVKLPLVELFRTPKIKDLAEYISARSKDKRSPIEPAEKKEYYPLSPTQKRMVVLHQLIPGTTGYNISFPIPLEGKVNKEKLETTFKKLIRRHESLRTSFIMVDNQTVQRVHQEVPFSVCCNRLSGAGFDQVIGNLSRPFDLTGAPLLRVHLVDTGLLHQVLFIDMHHIITDAESQRLLEGEFMFLYWQSGRALAPLRLQYKDYSRWQQQEANKGALKQQQAFWLNEFSSVSQVPVLDLPIDYPRPLMQSFEGNWVDFAFNTEETKIIRNLAKDNDMTLFMCLLAIFNILFFKLSGQEDIILGTPIAARRHVHLQQVIGMLVNTLALRNYPSTDKPLNQFLKEIKHRSLQAYENQEYPFEELVDKLAVKRDTSRNPVFDVMFNWMNPSAHSNDFKSHKPGELTSQQYKHKKGTARFDMVFSAREQGEHIIFTLEYSTRLFHPHTIDRWIKYLRNIVHHLPGNSNTKLSHIPMISEAEKKEILNLSGESQEIIDKNRTIHQWFEEQAEKTPDNIALHGCMIARMPGEDGSITYKELNEKANQLAHLLKKKGIGPDSVVGMIMERSIQMIVTILAVLKAGGAYLPIDPVYPGQRILSMLNDSEVTLLLTTRDLLGRFPVTLLKNINAGRRQLVRTPPQEQIKDFDSLPIPDRTLIDYRKYHQYIGEAPAKHTITIQATRGCPYHCLYCHKIWPKIHVARSGEMVFREILYAYDAGVRRFVFIDDIFNLDQQHAARFLELIIKSKLELQLFFPNGFRGDILTREFIDLMVAAGTVNLDVALESASPRIQRLIRKNLNLEKFKENVQYILQKYPQIILEMELMLGIPTETEEEALMTLNFLEELKWIHFPNLHILKIFPNTDMCKLAIEKGIPEALIQRSANLAYHELPDTLPFSKSFTRQLQARFMGEYFLSKERLLHVLPNQMKILTEDELVQKYDSYLPFKVKRFVDIPRYAGISSKELGDWEPQQEEQNQAPDFHQRIGKHFPVKPETPSKNAFRILLLDLSQLFSQEQETMLHHQIEEPLGLLYLMTYLNETFQDRIHGKILKSRIDFDCYEELKEIILDFKPALIGIRTLSYYREFFHKVVLMIRNWGVEVPIAAGGPYATSDYHFILQDGHVDLAILGEGEITLAHLVGKMIENNHRLPGQEVLQKIQGVAYVKNTSNSKQGKEKTREILLLDEISTRLDRNPVENINIGNRADDLLYVMYTSGSTGRPKGVMLEHGNLVNLIRYQYDSTAIDFSRVLQFTTITFDVSAQEIFSTLLAGGQLSVVSRDTLTNIPKLFKQVERDHIKTLFLPASFLKFLMNEQDFLRMIPHSVCHIVTAGEQVVMHEKFKKFLKNSNVCLHNHYGPSETHVVTTLMITPQQEIPMLPPIGRPVLNTTVYILDKGMHPVPVGIPGELVIGGMQVARGYLNNPELTAHRFCLRQPGGALFNNILKKQVKKTSFCLIPEAFTTSTGRFSIGRGCHPLFEKTAPPGPPGKNVLLKGFYRSHRSYKSNISKRIYRTGDLAKWLPDCNIQFLGRIDRQVKVRGFRVELGEIESLLLNHEKIIDCVVTVKSDEKGIQNLCAYIVSTGELSITELREYSGRDLPDYMIPSYFVFLDHIPLTSNRKVDHRSLPAPMVKTGEGSSLPHSETQKKLAVIWSEILNTDQIGIDDNFFELGGHSLKATLLSARVHREFQVKLPLAEVFKTPTIRGLSRYLQDARPDHWDPIKPVEQKEYYVLSPAQKRLYILRQMDLTSTAYNMPEIFPLYEKVNKKRLEESFIKLISRHESLRTSFHMIENQPVQRIHKYHELEFKIQYHDMSEVKVKEEKPRTKEKKQTTDDRRVTTGIKTNTYLLSEFISPFDLSQAPLLRVGLITTEDKGYLLLVDMHHIISDGISHEILIRDFMTLNRGESLPTLRIHYKDFAQWQCSETEINRMKHQEAFWINEFQGEIPVLNLPGDFPRPAVQSFEGSVTNFEIFGDEMARLKHMALIEGVTLYMLLLAVVNVLLAKLSAQEDIIIGTPIAARRHTDLEKIIGMFVNTLVMRNYPHGTRTFRGFLKNVKERTLDAFENQDYQFENLLEKIGVQRDAGRNPLFDVMFVMQDFGRLPADGKNGTIDKKTTDKQVHTSQEYDNLMHTSKFDLSIGAWEEEQKLKISCEFCTKLFKKKTIQRFMIYFHNIVSKLLDEPGIKIGELEIITKEEKKKIIYGFNHMKNVYPKEKTLDALFRDQAKRTPDHIAVTLSVPQQEGQKEVGSMTYRELHKKSNQLALYLYNLGVRKGNFVGLMVNRSFKMIIGILGILKAGCAYVPLNPNAPEARRQYMLAECNIEWLLTDAELEEDNYPGIPRKKPGVGIHPGGFAYVIFTSGSTGVPKGVPISHTNLSPLLHWGYRHLGIGPADRTLQNLAYYFDWSVWEIFITLTTGAALYITSDQILLNPGKNIDFIRQHDITVLHATPTQYSYMAAENRLLETLRYLFLGAEKLIHKLLERSFRTVSKDCRVFNMYGPTEATIIASVLEIHRAHYHKFKILTSIPIGKPSGNTILLVLDKYLKLCPVNVAGELFIVGDGISSGYLNNPELTAGKFYRSDRFNRSYRSYMSYITHRSYTYKTGDNARWLLDGNIEFLGRIDNQVKIRGYRIELDEIENRLLTHSAVKDAVVLAIPGTNPLNREEKYLCAYIVPTGKTSVNLKKYLSKFLPDYMIPNYLVEIQRIPQTPNGKTDTKALPIPVGKIEKSSPPRDRIEQKLAKVWREILSRDGSPGSPPNINIDDNFFELGGHSLKAAIMTAKLQKVLQVNVPLVEIFNSPTIRQLAAYIKNMNKENLAANHDNLVLLKKASSKATPIFFLHDGSGEVEGYVEFCKHLDEDLDFNCWGIRVDGIKDFTPQNLIIEEIARKYIKKIKKIQPRGPYYIAGWSLGGTIAFEMVRQWEQERQQVGFFTLIDAPPPRDCLIKDIQGFTIESEWDFIKKYLPWEEIENRLQSITNINQIWPVVVNHLESKSLDVRILKKIIVEYEAHVVPNYQQLDIRQLINYLNVSRSLRNARACYAPPGKINATVYYFAASQSGGLINIEGWNDHCRRPVHIFKISGDHFSIFRSPDVIPFARLFNRIVRKRT